MFQFLIALVQGMWALCGHFASLETYILSVYGKIRSLKWGAKKHHVLLQWNLIMCSKYNHFRFSFFHTSGRVYVIA